MRGVLDELGLRERPRIVVFNKIDLLAADDLLALRRQVTAEAGRAALFTSSIKPATLEPLRRELLKRVRARMQRGERGAAGRRGQNPGGAVSRR